jgi:hypothetical protein
MLHTSWGKFLLRLLVMVVLAVPFGSIFLIIPDNVSIEIVIIFKTFIPLLLTLFSMFSFSNYFFARFKLVSDEHSGLLPLD